MTIHEEIEAELARAIAKFPDCESLPNGTDPLIYKAREVMARRNCEQAYRVGVVTHAHIFEEEAMEVLAEEDPEKLRTELLQISAVALKWIRDIDRKAGKDSDSILGERTGAASLGTEDPREGAVPGNASGATDQITAGRRDLVAPQSTEASAQAGIGRLAAGGDGCGVQLVTAYRCGDRVGGSREPVGGVRLCGACRGKAPTATWSAWWHAVSGGPL